MHKLKYLVVNPESAGMAVYTDAVTDLGLHVPEDVLALFNTLITKDMHLAFCNLFSISSECRSEANLPWNDVEGVQLIRIAEW